MENNSEIILLPNVEALVARRVLTPEECMEWIQRAEQEGFQSSNLDSIFAGKRKE